MSEKIEHKHIDADALMQQRPEFLNEQHFIREIADRNKGWNKCNEYWIDLVDKMPVADAELRMAEYESAAAFISTVYGYDAQSRQCIEEMSELTQAINKFWRKQLKCGKVDFENVGFDNKERDNLIEEMADVQIMLWQMKHLLCCGELLEKEIREKLDRQIERIKAEDENKQR